MLDGVRQRLQFDGEVHVLDVHSLRHVQLHRCEVEYCRHGNRNEPIDECLRRISRRDQDGNLDRFPPHDRLQVGHVGNHEIAPSMTNLGGVLVDRGNDIKSTGTKFRILDQGTGQAPCAD